MFPEKQRIRVARDRFPIVTQNHLVQWELCKQGVGVCIMMEEIGDAEPRMRRVFPGLPPLPIPIWLVCHRELRTSRKIRRVYDLLAEELQRL
jgi:DNA-binding transcriptional LysR family regulator